VGNQGEFKGNSQRKSSKRLLKKCKGNSESEGKHEIVRKLTGDSWGIER